MKRLVILIAITALTAGCGSKQGMEKTAVPVRVVPVQQIEQGNTVRYSANIVPTSQVDLSFKSGGYVKSVRMVRGADGNMRKLEEGDWVRKGTVLAQVDPQDYVEKLHQAKAQLDRAHAELEKARLQFERISTLYAAKSATKPEYDRDKAQYESAQASVSSANAQVREAEIALNYCSLEAPFDGWIVKRNVDIGALVGAMTNGFSISNTQLVKAVFGVPDTSINRVKLGQAHVVFTDALPEPLEGKVTAISPAADPKSRVYSVEITIPNPHERLKSGMIARISLGGQEMEKALLAVPLESVIRDPQGRGFAVMIASGTGEIATAEVRPVKLRDAYGNMVSVSTGLAPGERVVTRGSTLIKSGDTIRIIP